jgi:hypothetical protein
LQSNFRLQIDGVDCTGVSRIETSRIARTRVGFAIPDLSVTLDSVGSQTWYAWYEEFLKVGRSDPGLKKAGLLTLLAPDIQSGLASVKLSGLGIYGLVRQTSASQTTIPQVVAELDCQELHLSVA